MLDDDTTSQSQSTESTASTETPTPRVRRRAASRPAGPPQAAPEPTSSAAETTGDEGQAPVKKKGTAKKAAANKTAAKKTTAKKTTAKKATAKKATATDKAESATQEPAAASADTSGATSETATPAKRGRSRKSAANATRPFSTPATEEAHPAASSAPASAATLLFQPPDPAQAVAPRRTKKATGASGEDAGSPTQESQDPASGEGDGDSTARRRRSRGGRGRKSTGSASESAEAKATQEDTADEAADTGGSEEESASSRRRRRRRRSGEDPAVTPDDPTDTVVRVRAPRGKSDAITSVEGSTRVEAKRQRRREGREAGRRRPPILSEAEFLARRESVERVMVIRQRGDVTQIAVLEENMLVEHYVARESQASMIGNVYLGRVQNVLPSMEAAFIDIGKGRNAVLYAGEVNWDLMGSKGSRRIEDALKPGQSVLVQVSKDPVGHKGARLTSMVSLPGRYLVYVPGGGSNGISRKLADTERNRLKTLLKEILPDEAGVIIRTAAEGASEEELTRDVTRLTARWEDIDKKTKTASTPDLLYGEPDTTIKVVRDLFTEDFTKLVISGDDAWDMVEGYVTYVAPDLSDRLEKYEGDGDVFSDYRIDEQISKGLERKVWLPSGGSLVIDRTEAMTVVDVNTGKFTGSGGNLEETVTKNNLEAAEEMVRQLRLRDIGGIIVIDFIDMVLENNRDLVLRRLVECLGRDRTRHQVAEVTSLGLVQMTRKRIGTGLLEAFSQTCEPCQGRGVIISQGPVDSSSKSDDNGSHRGGGSGASRGKSGGSDSGESGSKRSGRRRGGKGRADGGNASADGADSSDDGQPSDSAESVRGTESTEATADVLTADQPA